MTDTADEVAELKQLFDMSWKADQRAIKLWQEAHPGKELVWPDHADLVVWLLSERTALLEALAPFAALPRVMRLHGDGSRTPESGYVVDSIGRFDDPHFSDDDLMRAKKWFPDEQVA